MQNDLPTVIFTKKILKKVGDLGDVLANFLELQKENIQKEFEEKFSDAPKDMVKQVLNEFATLEGTKIPLGKADLTASGLNSALVGFCVEQLEKSRILREDEGMYELAHDALALQIANSRSAEERSLLEMETLVRSRFGAAIQTYLTKRSWTALLIMSPDYD